MSLAVSGAQRLILASASPRRLALLCQVGVTPDEVIAAAIEETALPREKPERTAARLAEAKGRAVARLRPNAFVVAADTVVACGQRSLPKPAAETEAAQCLALLSGRRHRVIGGICVIDPTGRAHVRRVVTVVTFKRLTEPEIARYVASREWHDKAGGYAVQGRAAAFVKRINGCYFNVVGLPLYATLRLLEGCGYLGASAASAGSVVAA